MFSLTSSHQYYLYSTPADMRGSFNSLCGIVQNKLERNPTSGVLSVTDTAQILATGDAQKLATIMLNFQC